MLSSILENQNYNMPEPILTCMGNNASLGVNPPVSFTSHGAVSGSNILIADDNSVNANLMKAILESTGERFNITIVNDGKEALDMISSSINFDLMILDIMMPKVNGLEVLKELRREDKNMGSAQTRRNCNFPVMIVSALTDPRTVAQGIEMGANDYMVKPISKDVFKAKVVFLINQKKMYDALINPTRKDNSE
ncbi:MAG: response regulator [Deltaproteobacteria bacterium]|jgi:CheY-like chemotaxis protein|nr:response regulator [Deltaproteobacteria bacterium]MCL5880547.1 response regulator [Deltaproteobacteria bacterium]MDA8304029.1 response regulator [Deltaproteobacteria bacterium]